MKKLSQEQIAKYVNSGGVRCPYCGSDNLVGYEFDYDVDISQVVVCENCNRSWTDVFKLSGILLDVEEEDLDE